MLILVTSCTSSVSSNLSYTLTPRVESPTPSRENPEISLPTETPTLAVTSTSTITPSLTKNASVIHFYTYTPTSEPTGNPNEIRVMLITQNGDLWTGGPGGVVRWDVQTGGYTVFTKRDGLAGNNITAIAQTLDGAVWFGTKGAGISRFDGTHWQTFSTRNGLPGDFIVSMTTTLDGTLWVDTETTPYKAKPNYVANFGRFDGQNWHTEIGGGFDKIVAAQDGSVWGITYRQGLGRFYNGKWEHISDLSYISAINVAQDGKVWIATPTNIYQAISRTLRNRLDPAWIDQPPVITAIAIGKDNIAWFGLSYRLFREDNRGCGERYDLNDERGVYRYDGYHWRHFTQEDGLVDNKVCAIVVGQDESVWIGTYDKGVSHFNGQNWTTYSVP